jgi:hypothetical protein
MTGRYSGDEEGPMRRKVAKLNNLEGQERFSRRVQHGVEILERERIDTVRLEQEGDTEIGRRGHRPRLIIDDAISRSKLFVSKSRSQLREVDSLLRSILDRPLGHGPGR